MKKTISITILMVIGYAVKAQNFGVTADLGISRIENSFLNGESKFQTYYGLGLFYAKQNESIWGIKSV